MRAGLQAGKHRSQLTQFAHALHSVTHEESFKSFLASHGPDLARLTYAIETSKLELTSFIAAQ
jgi:hypothetical protein